MYLQANVLNVLSVFTLRQMYLPPSKEFSPFFAKNFFTSDKLF